MPSRLNGTSPPSMILRTCGSVSLAHWLGLKNRNPPRNCRLPSDMKSMQVAGYSPAGYSHISADVNFGVCACGSGPVPRLAEQPASNNISIAEAIQAPAALRADASRVRHAASMQWLLRSAGRCEHGASCSCQVCVKRALPTWIHVLERKKGESVQASEPATDTRGRANLRLQPGARWNCLAHLLPQHPPLD